MRLRVLLAGMTGLGAGLAGCGGSTAHLATTLVPIGPATSAQLGIDARVLTGRLRTLGDSGAVASVQGHDVVVTSTGTRGAPVSVLTAPGRLFVRPLLCGAPPPATTAVALSGAVPPCAAQYRTNLANLGMGPGSESSMPARVPPDPALAAYRSTPAHSDDPNAVVLLPADPANGAQQYQRFVLGPAQLSDSAIASVGANFDRTANAWSVSFTMSPRGSVAWDQAAERNFHLFIAVDVDGKVETAPVIQPSGSSFSSFQGKGEISGNLTRASARDLAAILGSGRLATALRLKG